MTRRVVVFHPGVADDLAAIYDHYEQIDLTLRSRFETRLEEQVERIEMFPSPGSSSSSPTVGRCSNGSRTWPCI